MPGNEARGGCDQVSLKLATMPYTAVNYSHLFVFTTSNHKTHKCSRQYGCIKESQLLVVSFFPGRLSSACIASSTVYSGKFLYGANFRIFCMKPRDTKIKTAKILTVEILTANFERAIELMEVASKRWRF